MMEKYQASPNMMKFFENLLEIKEFVKRKYEESHDELLKDIYKKLDAIIKTSEKEEE